VPKVKKIFFHNFRSLQTLGIYKFYDKKIVVFLHFLFYYGPSHKIFIKNNKYLK